MNVTLRVIPIPETIARMVDMTADDLALLGSPVTERGEISIVLLPDGLGVERGHVKFEHRAAIVLNRGNSTKTLFIDGSDAPSAHESSANSGDVLFDAELPNYLRELGARLLSEVRTRWTGSLEKKPSGRFVEHPDNYWTVKIQPRDRSLALTVRGGPEQFEEFTSLDIKADRTGYSRFKVHTVAELPQVIELLSRVQRHP
jgi:hypothetical protein